MKVKGRSVNIVPKRKLKFRLKLISAHNNAGAHRKPRT